MATIWFFCVLLWTLLMMLFVLIMLPSDITSMMKSGFSTQTVGFIFLFLFGIVYGITMLVPAFRKCFYKLPWLYAYIIIITADILIISIGEQILNYGYSVQNDTRHTIFFWLMIMQIVVCRIAMCIYCHKKPMRIVRDEYEY